MSTDASTTSTINDQSASAVQFDLSPSPSKQARLESPASIAGVQTVGRLRAHKCIICVQLQPPPAAQLGVNDGIMAASTSVNLPHRTFDSTPTVQQLQQQQSANGGKESSREDDSAGVLVVDESRSHRRLVTTTDTDITTPQVCMCSIVFMADSVVCVCAQTMMMFHNILHFDLNIYV
jgi:hypothetical protein